MIMTNEEHHALADAVEAMGGAATFQSIMERGRQCLRSFLCDKEKLTRDHPDQWVVYTIDGVQCVSCCQEAALQFCDSNGIRRGDVMVEFLASTPSVSL